MKKNIQLSPFRIALVGISHIAYRKKTGNQSWGYATMRLSTIHSATIALRVTVLRDIGLIHNSVVS